MRCAALLLAAALLAGCGLPAFYGRVDVQGRDPAKVEADKLACWQQAEAEVGIRMTWGQFGLATLGVPGAFAADAIYRDENAEKRARIERAADACMASRGYTLKPE